MVGDPKPPRATRSRIGLELVFNGWVVITERNCCGSNRCNHRYRVAHLVLENIIVIARKNMGLRTPRARERKNLFAGDRCKKRSTLKSSTGRTPKPLEETILIAKAGDARQIGEACVICRDAHFSGTGPASARSIRSWELTELKKCRRPRDFRARPRNSGVRQILCQRLDVCGRPRIGPGLNSFEKKRSWRFPFFGHQFVRYVVVFRSFFELRAQATKK